MEDENKVWVYDIETLRNCFTYTAMERDSKKVVQFSIWNNINELHELINHLESCRGLIGFNNINFDYPVLHFILSNYDEWNNLSAEEIAELIYKEAQRVIKEDWSSIREEYVKVPQLDLFRIWHYDNRARMTSLKKLQIAMRYDNVQDMPYKHYEKITSQEQLQEILDYNLNDVDSTHDFYLKTLPKLELRRGLYQRYGLRCMNYPDSKIGEDLTLKLYCEATGQNEYEVRRMRTYRDYFKFSECFPHYMNFETEEFQGLVDYLKGIEVEELKGSFKYSFEYKGFQFDLGTGGIHGCIKAGVYQSTDTHIIVDVDVASLYPSLAIVNGLYPEHLGQEFLEVYEEGLLKPRLEAKKNGDKVMNTGFKLSLNSVYGKSNSEYSWLYDPLYTLKTTLAGQLSLCMLSEKVMSNIDDITMLQINTDGLTVIIDRRDRRKFYNLCKEWEKETGLILEYVAYKQMIIRDVNNYIGEYEDGSAKHKGAFKTYDKMIKDDEYHKSLSQAVVQRALSDYFLKDIPVETTIYQCADIYDFCKTFNASHGWTCETENENGDITPQQKTNRYYISKSGDTFRKTKKVEGSDDREIEIEAGGTKVTIFNEFVYYDDFSKYDVDYDYYIEECYKIIHKIDGTEERIAEAERKRKEEEKRKKQEEKFVKYCIDKQPTERQYELYAKDWLLEKYSMYEITPKKTNKKKK